MHIALVAPSSLPPNINGLLTNFGAMLSDDHRLDLIIGAASIPRRVKKGYTVVHNIEPPKRDWNDIRYCFTAVKDYLSLYRPDVIMNTSWTSTIGTITALAARRGKTKCVLRSTADWRSPMRFRRSIGIVTAVRWELRRRVETELAPRLADRVFTLGQAMKHYLENVGIEDSKIDVVPQPINSNEFAPVSERRKKEIRSELGLAGKRSIVLYVGRLNWMKGADRLEEIVANVVEQRPAGYQFCIIGRGPYGSQFQGYDRGQVAGPLTVRRANIPLYFKAADLLIHPSRSEGLPNVVLEAMAADLPIMAAPVGEIPNYIQNIGRSPSDYIKYIMEGEWTGGARPDWLNWEFQKRIYSERLREVVE